MKTQPLDLTKPIQQRNGREAVYLGKETRHLVFALREANGKWIVQGKLENGQGYRTYEHYRDIINKPEMIQLSGFVNVYECRKGSAFEHELGSPYLTKEQALIGSHSPPVAIIDLSTIPPFPKGQGL